MKKILLILLFCFFTNSLNCFALDLSANSCVLIEADTQRIIYGENYLKKMGMASTTKIMTCLLALDVYSPDKVITVSKNAASTEGSSVYLKTGEKMPFKDVLYGLMLSSGNDASVAIAENVGGDLYTFVECMNKKAKSLKLENTHFANPSGLNDDNHYTTAYDLAKLTAFALKNPTFKEIVSTKTKILKSLSGENDRYIKNHNKMLFNYDGCIGVKTGFTKKDGRCLVSAAQRDGLTLVCVTLNAPNDWSDHKKLLDYGFDNMKKQMCIKEGTTNNILVKNGTVPMIETKYSNDFSVYLTDSEKVSIKNFIPESIEAPVCKGDTVGFSRIYVDNNLVGEVNVISMNNSDITNKNKLIQAFVSFICSIIK